MDDDERRSLCREALVASTLPTFLVPARRAFANDPRIAALDALAGVVFGTAGALPPGLDAEVQDAPFVALLDSVLRRRTGVSVARPNVLDIGPELDFLEHRCDISQMSLVQFCCLALQARRRPSGRIAIVMMARDEGIYLPEWLAHSRLIGAERIFVYTNDNTDGSDALLEALAAEDLIVLVRNTIDAGVNPQRKAYQHAVLLLDELRDYRWATFIDADEFPYFGDTAPGALGRLLEGVERDWGCSVPASVFLPWRWRVTDRAFHRAGATLLADYPFGYDRMEGKSIVRMATVEGMCAVHWPESTPPFSVVDGMGRPMLPGRIYEGVERPYSGPTVEHYWSKSFVEYVVKKRRGEALALESGLFRRGWKEFFEWTAPWTERLYCPIAPSWIARVEAETVSILSRPRVSIAYEEVVQRYHRMIEAAREDEFLAATYRENLRRFTPQFR